MVLNKRATAVLFAGLLSVTSQVLMAAESVNFVSWGGSTQDAQKQAWADPFSKASGITVVQDGPTDYGKLKAMVESGNVQWDVVDVEADFALRAASEGLLEPLDFKVIERDKIDPRFVSDHGVGSFFFSFVLGYNEGKLGASKPQDWSALFDTKTYPGKRALYKWPSPGVLELALLADGVATDKLYPLDLDRAFKKLDTIKKDIVWWGGGAQSQQLLASGDSCPARRRRPGRRKLETEPGHGRHPGHSKGFEKQGRGDEVPGQRQQCQGPGRLLQPDRLCPGQRRQRGAPGFGTGPEPADGLCQGSDHS
jgi:putative spermidine/putrescine transport system substrate-binding protein